MRTVTNEQAVLVMTFDVARTVKIQQSNQILIDHFSFFF